MTVSFADFQLCRCAWSGHETREEIHFCFKQLSLLFYALFSNVSFEGPFWQLGAYGECGASSSCFTDCLQELPVTMTNSCPGNSGVEVKCSKFGCRVQKFKFGSLMCGSPSGVHMHLMDLFDIHASINHV